VRRTALPLACALLVAGPFCFAAIGDTDAGWHLALGRLVFQSGLPHTNALTWTAKDWPWYDTSWLWDAATYWLTARFGLIGLQAATLAVFALALWAVALACQRFHRHGAWLVVPLALLLLPRLTVRPHVATWTGVACVLLVCVYGEGRRTAFRFACAPIIALFGNLHSGAPFAAGLLGLFCAQEFFQGLRAPPAGGAAGSSGRRPLAEVVAAAMGVVALVANPGGSFNLRSLFWHLHVQQVVVIGEYLPPTLRMEPAFFLLLPLAVWLGLRARKEHPALLAASLLFGVLALRADRMVYEFQIVTAPLFALSFGALEKLSRRLPALVLALAAAGRALSHRFDEKLIALRLAAAWDPNQLPVRTAAFAREHRIRGRLFNAYDWGGYVEWALPETPAFADGRVQCYPADFFPRFYAASHSPAAFAAFLKAWDVEWALPSRTNPWLGGRGLFDPAAWALVDWDAVSEVRLRRDVPRFAPLIESFEYKRFAPGLLLLPAIARLPRGELLLFAREAERYARDHLGDEGATRARCAALVRLRLAEAEGACAGIDPQVVAAAGSLAPALQ
jgi:hypothetical protein